MNVHHLSLFLGTELRCYEKIQDLLKLKPDYKPPADYRPPNNIVHEKVWIPQDEHCEINFVGLLRGPKGNTLKALEIETGTSIIIRGKGLRRDEPLPGANEPIHAYITATDPTVLKAVSEKIKSILDDALNGQDGGNTLKRNQMSELALLNGTYKAKGGTHCSNCDSDQHKTYECSKAPNLTANIVCISCGGSGHVATDCLTPRTGYRAAQHYEFDNEVRNSVVKKYYNRWLLV
uniref:Branchpoint-bridging protein n=1 Tax=Panagrolaimus superbus TaxID=310955 RepID=A0A914Z5E0_9BILA